MVKEKAFSFKPDLINVEWENVEKSQFMKLLSKILIYENGCMYIYFFVWHYFTTKLLDIFARGFRKMICILFMKMTYGFQKVCF